MSQQNPELTERVALLERVVEQQGALLTRIVNSPTLKLAGLQVDGFAMSRLVISEAIDPGADINRTHPYDAAIKKGEKLAELSQELGRYE